MKNASRPFPFVDGGRTRTVWTSTPEAEPSPRRPGGPTADAGPWVLVAVAAVVPIAVAAPLVALRGVTAPANLALLLVVLVVGAAAVGGRWAGLAAALGAAASFDFFFTRPYGSLTIASRDDVETTVLLLVVGLAVGTVASRGRQAVDAAAEGRSEVRRIHHLAEAMARGDDPAEVIAEAEGELVQLLDLRSATFEASPVGSPLPRLERSGTVSSQREVRFRDGGFELPIEGIELPVLARGRQVGRFVLVPEPDVGVTLEQRIVAVALTDQVGAALLTRDPLAPDLGAGPADLADPGGGEVHG